MLTFDDAVVPQHRRNGVAAYCFTRVWSQYRRGFVKACVVDGAALASARHTDNFVSSWRS